MTDVYTGSNWIDQLPDMEKAATLDRMTLRTVAKGSIIYSVGQTHTALWQLRTGTVRVTNQSPDGKEVVYAIFGPGDCFGEISLLDDLPAGNTATALENIELAELAKEDFDQLYRSYPAFAHQLTRLMCARVRHLLTFYADVTLLTLEQRIANRFVYIHSEHPIAPGRNGLQFTQQDLASMVGATRQAVSKVLNRWREEGIIDLEYGSITVCLPQRLSDIANGES